MQSMVHGAITELYLETNKPGCLRYSSSVGKVKEHTQRTCQFKIGNFDRKASTS